MLAKKTPEKILKGLKMYRVSKQDFFLTSKKWLNILDFETIPWSRIETELRRGQLLGPIEPFSLYDQKELSLTVIGQKMALLVYSLILITSNRPNLAQGQSLLYSG